MKTVKYIIITIGIALTGIATNVTAQSAASLNKEASEMNRYEKSQYFNKLESSLLYGLSSDVHGVVESALFNTMNYKIVYPEFKSDKVLRKLSNIALEGNSHSLRFKAYLTLDYFQNQHKFDEPAAMIGYIDIRDQNKVFFYLQSEVQEERVTVSN